METEGAYGGDSQQGGMGGRDPNSSPQGIKQQTENISQQILDKNIKEKYEYDYKSLNDAELR